MVDGFYEEKQYYRYQVGVYQVVEVSRYQQATQALKVCPRIKGLHRQRKSKGEEQDFPTFSVAFKKYPGGDEGKKAHMNVDGIFGQI